MQKLYVKLDYYIQLLLIIICAIDITFGQNNVAYLLVSIAVVQSVSIVYHSVIAQTRFTQLRKIHYTATCIVLITLFVLYFSANSNVNIFGESIIMILLLITGISFILVICYVIATYQHYIASPKK
jgi:hypothetical protein